MPNTSKTVWTHRSFDFRTAIDTTLPVMPASFDFSLGWCQTIDGGPNPFPGHLTFDTICGIGLMVPRDTHLRRMTLAIVTHAQVTGPIAAPTIDLSLDWGGVPPPYVMPTSVEIVGPIACPVGSGFTSKDFDFAVGSRVDKGDIMAMSMTGLDNAVLGATPGADVSMVSGLMAFEWEIFEGT